MPYGQFVSSEPVGPGLYRFGLSDGSSQLYGGAPAEDLNKKILAGMPSPTAGMIAQNDAVRAPAAPSVSDVPAPNANAESAQARGGGLGAAALGALGSIPVVGPGVAAAALGASPYLRGLTGGTDASKRAAATPPPPPAPATPEAASGAQQAQPAATVPASAQEPGTAQPPAPAQPAEGTALGYSAKGMNGVEGPVVIHNGVPMVYVAPSKGRAGGYTALGKQVTEQFAQAEAVAADSNRRAAEAQAAGVQAEVENIAAQQGAAEEAKWQAAVQANDQQEQITALQERVNAAESTYQKARAEANSGTVDENRYMRGSRGVLSAIGMAMGAFGAILGKSPNFAQQFIENQIDRDIRGQEAALKLKGERADNALADLVRQTGSLNTAKLTLKQLMGERVAADLRSAELTGKDKALAAYKAETAARLEASVALTDQARKASTLEHILGNQMYFQQGRAGSSGGFIPMTQESMGRKQEAEIKSRELALKERDAARGGDAKAVPTERTAMIAEDTELIKLGQKILNNPALKADSEYFEPAGSVARHLPFGASIVSKESNELYQDLQKWKNARIKAITGAGVSNQEAERIAAAEVGNMSTNAIRRGVKSGLESAETRTKTNLVALTPEQQLQQLAAISLEAKARLLKEEQEAKTK